jgi:hypothetical protein
MVYYTIRLHPDYQNLCTIATPFWEISVFKTINGIIMFPIFFQEKLSDLMQHLDIVRTYLDDILVISSGTLDDHLEKTEVFLKFSSDKGLRVNAEKSTFCAKEIQYIGCWISKSGIQHTPKKVEAIKNMVRPTTRKELRRFIDMVNYYHDIWVRRSSLVAPLTSMTGKNVKLIWTDVHQEAFDDIKKIICREVMLTFPDFSKPFHIYTDASDTQLGAVITQEKNLLHFIVEN